MASLDCSVSVYIFLNDNGEIQVRRGTPENAEEIAAAARNGFCVRLEEDAIGSVCFIDHDTDEQVEPR